MPRVLYLVTEPWYFANHRLDHAKALVADGFEVHVATRRGERWDELVVAGCTVHEIDVGRGMGSPRSVLRESRAVRSIVREARPDVVHAVALKPVALSLFLIAMRRRPSLILSVNGLGISATERGARMLAIRTVIRAVSGLPRVHLLFQTNADRVAVLGSSRNGVVIPGVGVDTDRFKPGERAAVPPCVVVYLGRAVASKGLLEMAAALSTAPLASVEVHLYCAIDASSPGSLDEVQLNRIRQTPGIWVHPPTTEPERVLASAHGAILASRAGEGVSKFVLEALASGTPVLLSAQSGSGEVVEPGVTGLVFDATDDASIRASLAELAAWSAERRAQVGAACRAAAEERYALGVVLPHIIELHRSALEPAK